jgi:hypothetical protein
MEVRHIGPHLHPVAVLFHERAKVTAVGLKRACFAKRALEAVGGSR